MGSPAGTSGRCARALLGRPSRAEPSSTDRTGEVRSDAARGRRSVDGSVLGTKGYRGGSLRLVHGTPGGSRPSPRANLRGALLKGIGREPASAWRAHGRV